jgi:glycosyltransferase involved in cell wall biosynthesis
MTLTLAPDEVAVTGTRFAGTRVGLITVVVLTYNEELNLPACLESLHRLGCPVFVVDSGSTDRTRDIARRFGASVVEHPFDTHAAQWTWALETLPIASPWVLALDADQRATPELVDELRALDPRALERAAGAYVCRRQVFRGKWIRYGGYYPKYLLKLFRRDRVRIDRHDLVDHHFYVDGPTLTLAHDIVEANVKEDDISFWIDKHTRYARLLAREELQWRTGQRTDAIEPSLRGNPDQRTLALKRAWRRMPLYVRPFLYFVYRYVFRLGVLDGKQGAIFHFMQAFWFRLLVDINLDQMLSERRTA